MLSLQCGQEDAGQLSDYGGVPEVVEHEALDRGPVCPVLVAKPFRKHWLNVYGQLVHRPPGKQVEMAPYRHEKCLGSAELLVFLGAQQACPYQLRRIRYAMNVLADPEERLEVPQAALALLYIGFDDVPPTTVTAVTGVALLKLGFDELGDRLAEELLLQPNRQIVGQGSVADQEAMFQQRRADRVVVLSEPNAVGYVPC